MKMSLVAAAVIDAVIRIFAIVDVVVVVVVVVVIVFVDFVDFIFGNFRLCVSKSAASMLPEMVRDWSFRVEQHLMLTC